MRKPIVQIGSKRADETADAALGRLRRVIESGPYPLYSRLPPERELSAQLNVSRARLREALEMLAAEGRIWRHVGKGTFIGSGPPPSSAPTILDPSHVTPKELIEARLVMEPAVAGFAASTARPDDIKRMQHCVARREAATDSEAYNLWDRNFHRAIADASQNPVFISLFDRLNVLRSAPSYKRDPMQEPFRSISTQEHRDIVDAISERNPIAAFNSMRVHIASVQASFYSWAEMEVGTDAVGDKK
jgi:DNA-binding FadR family transcriptional regulator